MKDPRVRKDGTCACGCGKKLPRSKRAKKYAGAAQLEADPFATSTCCRRFHGCPLDNGNLSDEEIERRSKAGRHGKAAGQMARWAA